MTDSQELISERVVATAERIEEMDSEEDFDPLEVKVEASIDGTLREVILVLSTGGPHIEVNVTSGTVSGYWGMERHRCHVDNEAVLDAVAKRYSRHWEENVLA